MLRDRSNTRDEQSQDIQTLKKVVNPSPGKLDSLNDTSMGGTS